jgi:uncharacterized protein YcbK (DUF882 family)
MTERFKESRRAFLSRGVIGLGVSAMACVSPATAFAHWARPHHQQKLNSQSVRALSFHNLHTDERLSVTYWAENGYDRNAWGKINHILRDHYTGDQHVMDLRLVDLLHDVQGHVQNDRPIEIISGYRSPATNTRLREASGGVAKNSYHMRGMATDIRFDGTPLEKLHAIALTMQRGGVGYYPTSDFVHVDVGPVRRWG